jgi:hypothetical protein
MLSISILQPLLYQTAINYLPVAFTTNRFVIITYSHGIIKSEGITTVNIKVAALITNKINFFISIMDLKKNNFLWLQIK